MSDDDFYDLEDRDDKMEKEVLSCKVSAVAMFYPARYFGGADYPDCNADVCSAHTYQRDYIILSTSISIHIPTSKSIGLCN